MGCGRRHTSGNQAHLERALAGLLRQLGWQVFSGGAAPLRGVEEGGLSAEVMSIGVILLLGGGIPRAGMLSWKSEKSQQGNVASLQNPFDKDEAKSRALGKC